MIEPKCMFHFRARMYICKFCTSFDVLMLIVLFFEGFVSKQLHADNCSYLYKTFHVYSIFSSPICAEGKLLNCFIRLQYLLYNREIISVLSKWAFL